MVILVGHLVTSYLTGDSSAAQYLEQFVQSGPEYNKYNLLLIELSVSSTS